MSKSKALSKGVERRIQGAAELCAVLEEHAAKIVAAFNAIFSPFFGPGGAFDLRPLAPLLVRAIESSLARLVEAEEAHQAELARLDAARSRRDWAIAEVRAQIGGFRDVGLRGRTPVVPPGETPHQADALLAAARSVARRLKHPHLRLAPGIAAGIKLYPRLRTDFDGAVAELKTALVEVKQLEGRTCATRVVRDEVMARFDFLYSTSRQLARSLGALLENQPPGKGGN